MISAPTSFLYILMRLARWSTWQLVDHDRVLLKTARDPQSPSPLYSLRCASRNGSSGKLFCTRARAPAERVRRNSALRDKSDKSGTDYEFDSRYVERNPVRAGLVARAEEHAWSSAAGHCGLRKDAVLAEDFPPGGGGGGLGRVAGGGGRSAASGGAAASDPYGAAVRRRRLRRALGGPSGACTASAEARPEAEGGERKGAMSADRSLIRSLSPICLGDPFEGYCHSAVPAVVEFINDFLLYHVNKGGVHCGTNDRREIPSQRPDDPSTPLLWWEEQPW